MEWTPMCAVILAQDADSEKEVLTCVSLATGTKCLPSNLLSVACGTVLHDCHAEILALRGLNRFLLLEVKTMLSSREAAEPCPSVFLEPNLHPMGFTDCAFYRLRSNISVILFTTSAPCGSASLDLLIASKTGNNKPWKLEVNDRPPTEAHASVLARVLHGHGNFSPALLDAMRTKPSRSDAHPTYSKSCSDKLTISQFVGVLRFPADLFIIPVQLERIVIPAEYYHDRGWQRSFAGEGRLCKIVTRRKALQPYIFKTSVIPCDLDVAFEFAKPLHTESEGAKVSNVSALYVKGVAEGKQSECLVNGVRQGFRHDSKNKAKQSCVCRNQLWALGVEVAELAMASEFRYGGQADTIVRALKRETYGTAKASEIRAEHADLKKNVCFALDGHWQNRGDEDWSLDVSQGRR